MGNSLSLKINYKYNIANSSIYIFNLAIAIQIFGMIVIAFTNASFYGKHEFGLMSAMVIIIFNLRKKSNLKFYIKDLTNINSLNEFKNVDYLIH